MPKPTFDDDLLFRLENHFKLEFFAFPLYIRSLMQGVIDVSIIRDLTCIYIESYNTHLIYTPIRVEGDTHNSHI